MERDRDHLEGTGVGVRGYGLYTVYKTQLVHEVFERLYWGNVLPTDILWGML